MLHIEHQFPPGLWKFSNTYTSFNQKNSKNILLKRKNRENPVGNLHTSFKNQL